MLSIQKHIHQFGLEYTIAKFKLICKEYPHKILLKYNQIESDFVHEEVLKLLNKKAHNQRQHQLVELCNAENAMQQLHQMLSFVVIVEKKLKLKFKNLFVAIVEKRVSQVKSFAHHAEINFRFFTIDPKTM